MAHQMRGLTEVIPMQMIGNGRDARYLKGGAPAAILAALAVLVASMLIANGPALAASAADGRQASRPASSAPAPARGPVQAAMPPPLQGRLAPPPRPGLRILPVPPPRRDRAARAAAMAFPVPAPQPDRAVLRTCAASLQASAEFRDRYERSIPGARLACHAPGLGSHRRVATSSLQLSRSRPACRGTSCTSQGRLPAQRDA